MFDCTHDVAEAYRVAIAEVWVRLPLGADEGEVEATLPNEADPSRSGGVMEAR